MECPAEQPVALLERATWPDERVLKSTLAGLPRLAHDAKLRSPTLLVIGEVAALAQVRGFIDLQEQSGAAYRRGWMIATRRGFVDAVGNTPLIHLEKLSRETGCEIYGKAEFMNPGRIGEGSRGQVDRARGRAHGRAQARWHRGGRHGGQYRHRPCACVQFARLPADPADARQPVAREIPAARGPRRRSAQGAGGSLQQPRPVPAPGRAAWRRNCPMPSGPTSSTTPPTGARMWNPPGRKSGSRPRAASMPSWPAAARVARWPARPNS